ncbi:MAG: hypothetical protein EXQ85_03955 [Alphaproteobacteria bacterium]|nr:hypothetical protein [Alphaproteobacteria bacterium]
MMRPFQRRVRVQVVPKLAVPVGAEALALGDNPADVSRVPGQALERSGLCLMIVNAGIEPVVVVEIGLMGRFGCLRITMREPLLHDRGGWPRHLEPGESVIAYFASRVRHHEVLSQMRQAFATTEDGVNWIGASPALRYFVRAFPRSQGRSRRFGFAR